MGLSKEIVKIKRCVSKFCHTGSRISVIALSLPLNKYSHTIGIVAFINMTSKNLNIRV